MRENWDDLRFILAVAEEGSVNAAARRLGVNHATILRRIAAYEHAAGIPLFEKSARGYIVPAAQRQIIEAAREVDRAVQAVQRTLQGVRAPLTGEVRITSTDSFCTVILPAILTELRRQEPELRLELLSTNLHLDLSRTHADLAVRPAEVLPDGLVGDAAARMSFGLYRASGYKGRAWLGMSGQLQRTVPGRWLASRSAEIRPELAADSFMILGEMVRQGQGMAILPDYIAQGDRGLEAVPDVVPAMSVTVWVASHPDLSDVPRIARVRGALCRALSNISDRLAPGSISEG